MNSCIHSGLRWLANSGIQQESGGVSSCYQAEKRRYRPVSTASTAYFISTLLRADREGGSPTGQALQAARFLMEQAFDLSTDLFPFEIPNGDAVSRPPARFLDCGTIIRALLDLWRATGDEAYQDCAERCGLAMHSRMTTVDGGFFPLYNLVYDQPEFGSGSWPVEAGVYQLKVGLAFRELAEATGLGEFEADVELLNKWCLRRHEAFLHGDGDSEDTMSRLHAYCCFLEGLLPTAGLDSESARVLQFGILRVENLIDELGEEFLRCDAVAQLLRLRLFADNFGVMELDQRRAESEAASLEEFQMQTLDPKADGGFALARRAGTIVPHVSLAATGFAIQALGICEQLKDGRYADDWRNLV